MSKENREKMKSGIEEFLDGLEEEVRSGVAHARETLAKVKTDADVAKLTDGLRGLINRAAQKLADATAEPSESQKPAEKTGI